MAGKPWGFHLSCQCLSRNRKVVAYPLTTRTDHLMARSTTAPYSSRLAPAPANPKVPTIEELMRQPQLPPWVQPLPIPPLQPDPFGPLPIVPAPPIEVDPPSRPPEYMFGPPYISRTPMPAPFAAGASPILYLPLAAQNASGGLPGLMQRSGIIDPSVQDATPAGGLVELLQKYLSNSRDRGD